MALSRAIPFSVLDLSPIPAGARPGEALRNSIDLARRAEEWGFHRYWVAEHHNMPGIASSAPAVLIGHLADATDHMRIGSGGVMLPNHPPLVVAEQFGMLEALHPGRIDLGIGRAPGTDQVTASALRRSAAALSDDDFPEQLGQLLGFFQGTFPEGHPYRKIRAVPGLGDMPALWLLGSSGYSAQVAGMLGIPFAFAHHFMPANTLPALELYRSSFRPSAVLDQPFAMIGVSVLCAPTDEEARFLHGSSRLQMLRHRTGVPGAVPSPEEAASFAYSPRDLAIIDSATGAHVVGDPAAVSAGLDELMEATQVDEMMVTSVTFDHKARLRSFELIAELTGLTAAD